MCNWGAPVGSVLILIGLPTTFIDLGMNGTRYGHCKFFDPKRKL